jgi:cytosine/adenosine deaminase-related metal-dependent hydrolase
MNSQRDRCMTRPLFHIAGAEWLGNDGSMPAAIQASERGEDAIDLGPAIAFPGLVNSHEHLEFNCYPALGTPPYSDFLDWSVQVHRDHSTLVTEVEAVPRAARVKIGLLKNLLSGVTSVVHHGPKIPEDPSLPIRVISNFDIVHSPELDPRGPWEFLKGWRRRPIVAHLAEATTAESRRRALGLVRWNVFRRPLIGVHGVAFTGADFSLLDALVWCPASNLFLLGRTADVAAASKVTTILFGSDSTISAPGTLWDHIRIARDLGGLSDRALFGALTIDALRFWNATGGESDFVVARRRDHDPWTAFYAINPADLLLVVSNGRVVLADEAIIEARPDLSACLAPLNVGTTRKHVALDVEKLRADFANRAPDLDLDAMINRLAGPG